LVEAGTKGVKVEDGIAFKQSLTHNELAARIGTVREVVTRALTRLQDQGMIKVEGKTVIVRDQDALRAYVDA
jgi:CRP/FNR family transcriptional regulator